MALGMNLSGGADAGDIVAYCKYDARSGRVFRADRKQDASGSYSNEIVDITSTFRAIVDMENIEVGYLLFAAGTAPQSLLVPLGAAFPPKPAGDWGQGLRFMMKLHSSCGGDIREMSGNSKSFLRGFDELHTAYEAGKAANPGKLPVVKLASSQPVTSGSGTRKSTNYQPTFEIESWATRPADLVFVAKAGGSAPAAQPSAPSTGSTVVAPPKAKTPQLATTADDDFG